MWIKEGYRQTYVRGRGYVLEHRLVMEQTLGRPLHTWENLELWVKAQPAGQRPEDLAAWVVENYREYVQAVLDGRPHLFAIQGEMSA